MTHDELRDRLGAYLDGELDDAQRAELEAHLASCASCRGELAALRALDGALAEQPVPDPGDAYWARFADRVTERLRPQAAEEPARLYERLTGWLFPRGRFAWARAAVAVATCTILVTVGLHGFRTAEVAVQPRQALEVQPVGPRGAGAPDSATQIGPPSIQSIQGSEVAMEADLAKPNQGKKEAISSERQVGAPGAAPPTKPAERVSAPTAPPVSAHADEGSAPSGPSPVRLGAALRPAPAAPSDDRMQQAAEPELGKAGPGLDHLRGGRTTGSADEQPQASPLPSATARLEERDSAGGASEPKGNAAAPQAIDSKPVVIGPPSARELSGAAAPQLSFQGSRKEGAAKQSVRLQGPPTTPAEAETLLAREARLWPQRDDPVVRPQLEDLARDLVAHADDARVRARASELLGYLAATSSDAADADRWRALMRTLPEP